MNSSIATESILAPTVVTREELLGLVGPPLAKTAVRETPDDLFLDGGSGRVYRRAADVDPEIWRAAFEESHKDFEYYRLLEETMNHDFSYRYLVLFDRDDNPVGLQPLILVDQDLAAATSQTIQRSIGLIRKLWPRFLRTGMLLAGCLVGDASPGIISPAHPKRVSALLAEALLAFARRNKISLISAKDFPAAMRDDFVPLVDANYTRLEGFPPLMLDLGFGSFDKYAGQVSRTTRKNLRRKLRRTEAAVPPVTLEVLTDCGNVIDEIYPLYLEVTRRASVEFEVLSREYFLEAGERMPGRHRYFIWRREGKAIAFSFCTLWKNAIYDNDLGLDYEVAYDLSLYHRTFHDIIVWALENGLKEYHCAPFNYGPKSHLRLELVDVDLYVRHTSPLINAVLKRVAPYFAPAKSDPVLRNYPRRTKD